MSTPWQQAIGQLSELMKLQKGYVIPFVGAGVSRAANLPTWRGLADAILESAYGFKMATELEVDGLKGKSPLDVLSFCRDCLGPDMFMRQVSRVLKIQTDFVPPEIATLCWKLNESLVVTTNLDSVLEEASVRAEGVLAEPITPYDSMSIALHSPGRRVLHLHGQLTRFETWVMTHADYDNVVSPNSPVGAFLQALLLDRVILFIGYSCNDPDLNMFMEKFKSHFPKGSANHYAIMSELSVSDRKRLMDYGIFPIEYSPSSVAHPEVGQFINELYTSFDPRNAELFADQKNKQAVTVLLPVSDLREMTLGQKREQLNKEFISLFDKFNDYALAGDAELPPVVRQRRSETLEHLAAAWQVDTVPPVNALEGREVISEIGRGGFGVVWLVEDVRTRERQALKVAHLPDTSNYKFVVRFKQGIRAMRRLTNHGVQNTTKYLGQRDVPLCVFMEYIDGGDLGKLIKEGDPSLEDRLRLCLEICEIVQEAHGIPVYHRDLKPSNVLIRWDDSGRPHAVLSDFDLAWFEGAISKTTTRIGDQAFAAPEQLKESRTAKQARAESDVYSLGMLVKYIISGHMPATGQWYNQNLREEVFAMAKNRFSWIVSALKLADLVSLCAKEQDFMRPSIKKVVETIRTIHRIEVGNDGIEGAFVEEVRLLTSWEFQNSYNVSMPWVIIEEKRSSGRTNLQASFYRNLQESDDRGRFKARGERDVKALSAAMKADGWSTVSSTWADNSRRLVVSRELSGRSIDYAHMVSRQISDVAKQWVRPV